MMSKHTPGPWRWEVNRETKRVELCGGTPLFDKTVLSFKRWGMQRAQPVFLDWTNGMTADVKKTSDIAKPLEGREHHASWFAVIDHPDANLIAAAPDLLNALEEAEAFIKAAINEYLYRSHTGNPVDWAKETLPIVSEAIKKAKGEGR